MGVLDYRNVELNEFLKLSKEMQDEYSELDNWDKENLAQFVLRYGKDEGVRKWVDENMRNTFG
jgi:hypothetical protein